LFIPPRRLANDDKDGVTVVEVETGVEVVLVETALLLDDEFFDTAVAAAAAAAASINNFTVGKLASMEGLNPKLEKLDEFEKLVEQDLLVFNAFT